MNTSRPLRAMVAQRIDGREAISDVPVDHADRVYLIELQQAAFSRLESARSLRWLAGQVVIGD